MEKQEICAQGRENYPALLVFPTPLALPHRATRVGACGDGPKVVVGNGNHDSPTAGGGTWGLLIQCTASTSGVLPFWLKGRAHAQKRQSLQCALPLRPRHVSWPHLAALARPARTALSVVKASSGRSESLILVMLESDMAKTSLKGDTETTRGTNHARRKLDPVQRAERANLWQHRSHTSQRACCCSQGPRF